MKDPIPESPIPPFPPSSAHKTTWGAPVALALVTIGISIINPMLLIFVPLAFLFVGLEPRRAWTLGAAALLLWGTFSGRSGGLLWWYGRGWALMLSAWFLLAVVLLPRAGLLSRALAAVAASLVSVSVLLRFNEGGWTELDFAMGRQLRNAAGEFVAVWQGRLEQKPWLDELVSATYRFADIQALTYPALVAIASLAGLALAWWFWRRLALQERNPLAPLREFKFHDELIWLVVIGAALVVLPLNGIASRAGTNLLLFMAALYVVRGFAVMVALFGAPTLAGALIGALVFLMLYPIVMATTLMVGLTDTWLDLRARRLRQDNEKH